jgi:hypothetical protein
MYLAIRKDKYLTRSTIKELSAYCIICTHEVIKSRLNSENACNNSVQSLLSSRLLSRNSKVKIYKTIILPFVLYGYETWLPTIREEHKLWVFENRVLRRIFGFKRDDVTGKMEEVA